MVPARLILQSGEKFEGLSPSWQKSDFFGEVVFATGMTGYVESLTDPSYAGQILTFTFPLIGNYGVPDENLWESNRIHAKGVIVNTLTSYDFHYQAESSLAQWLRKQNVPLITGIDTRALTKTLRKEGVALGVITRHEKKPKEFFDPNQTDLVAEVTIKKPQIYGKGKKTVIAIDCGMKENILRNLLRFPIQIKRVPAGYDFTEEEFDGVFISNGPGDPVVCKKTIAHIEKALAKKKPVFGICLGAQLLALSIGAKTHKLPYGHRGQNQPCQHLENGRCYLTSQNHGYAITEKTLPKNWKVTFRNLNDGSVEGIEHQNLPFFAVQFHPEACPGPTDTLWLFDKFYGLIK
ncbi:MAG: glutamine-hydrolyzing carbamoyl-phosphate synthase small subunit [Verrucomicrobia bacterium]|nr:glutamine-hydrolyzing carbamoyl-phosphate synthase small subunit [Verrucomicrobiota bacterium]